MLISGLNGLKFGFNQSFKNAENMTDDSDCKQ